MQSQCYCNPSGAAVCPSCGLHNNAQLYNDKTSHHDKFKEQSNLPELETFKFSEGMKAEMTRVFYSATGNKTKRKAPRRAMIFLAIVTVCKSMNIPFDKNQLMQVLTITDRHVNTAMKEMAFVVPVAPVSISVADVLKDLMKLFDVKDEIFPLMIETYDICRRTSVMFNSAKPETIANGLMYYHLKIGLGEMFNEDNYFQRVKVSKDGILAIDSDIKKIIQ
ncbi:MAG: hypothetical protein H0X02_05950 [Nitrosomonas sp.]|nr:hypothetical protein [Nitrosomonas sp.]